MAPLGRRQQELDNRLVQRVALQRHVIADDFAQQPLPDVIATRLAAAARGNDQDLAALARSLHGRARADVLVVPIADDAAEVCMLCSTVSVMVRALAGS